MITVTELAKKMVGHTLVKPKILKVKHRYRVNSELKTVEILNGYHFEHYKTFSELNKREIKKAQNYWIYNL